MNRYENFECHTLDDDGNLFFCGELPEQLRVDDNGFEMLWRLHPQQYHIIKIHGRLVATPRWQQAFGADYYYTGRTNRALPLPEECLPILAWSWDVIHDELNGLLLNWYDGQLKHYIGPHHDNTTGLVEGAPIVTISFGEERIFRLSHPKTKQRRDFAARDGTAFITPYDTNLAWKHAVPRSARWRGQRISITIRAFEAARASASDLEAKTKVRSPARVRSQGGKSGRVGKRPRSLGGRHIMPPDGERSE